MFYVAMVNLIFNTYIKQGLKNLVLAIKWPFLSSRFSLSVRVVSTLLRNPWIHRIREELTSAFMKLMFLSSHLSLFGRQTTYLCVRLEIINRDLSWCYWTSHSWILAILGGTLKVQLLLEAVSFLNVLKMCWRTEKLNTLFTITQNFLWVRNTLVKKIISLINNIGDKIVSSVSTHLFFTQLAQSKLKGVTYIVMW